jgi:hypothetical protein
MEKILAIGKILYSENNIEKGEKNENQC